MVDRPPNSKPLFGDDDLGGGFKHFDIWLNEDILDQLRYIQIPVEIQIFTISTGAGFLASPVVPRVF